MANREKKGDNDILYLGGAPKSVQMVITAMKIGRKGMTNLDSVLSRDIITPTKVHIVKGLMFPVVMYKREKQLVLLNYGAREDCWSPLDSKEIKPVTPKGNQP